MPTLVFIFMRKTQSILFLSSQSAKSGHHNISLTQCSHTVNECDWHSLAGNVERINSHCLTRYSHDCLKKLEVVENFIQRYNIIYHDITLTKRQWHSFEM